MTNRDRTDRLMWEGKEILRELTNALARRSWNLAIRRAQEVVELTLKALLAEMGVDYPKIHDVASHFTDIARGRGLEIEESTLKWLEETSGRLAARRAPAFYFETEYGESEAREAVQDAKKVMEFGAWFLEKLRGH